jgi:AGCS family alanine or glycine:cation symporter
MLIDILNEIDSVIWGAPLLLLLVGTGIMLTIRLGLIQVTKLPLALKLIFKPSGGGAGDVNSFQALCLALAATVGTGNIVGVATAIKAGGPGALFWMWMAAFFGMATKYAEGLLAVKYRVKDDNGQIAGGPMYYIENGMGRRYRPLAILFAFSGIFAAMFGIGNFPQVNAIVSSVEISFGISPLTSSLVLAIIVAAITLGGIHSISRAASKIVPFMAILYIIICAAVLVINLDKIPSAISLVIDSAFTGTAAAGGFLGATMMMALRNGVARGVFSNESGLGSAPIVAAAAKTNWPAEQGLISMTGTFIDTIIICTMTGLTLVLTGAWTGTAEGAAMTSSVFSSTYGEIGALFLTLCLILFAFTTILGWNYYGERCCFYLFGINSITPYRWIFIILVASASFLKLDEIWILADILNGIMAFPNLIAIIALTGVIIAETKKYLDHIKN